MKKCPENKAYKQNPGLARDRMNTRSKLQTFYFGLSIRRAGSIWKTIEIGKNGSSWKGWLFLERLTQPACKG
jgi:hypothetical protein